MDRPEIETALQAANVALTGRRTRAVSGFASIELRGEASQARSRWDVLVGVVVGLAAFVAVFIAWLY
jgi:hypothetical protein